MAHQLPGQSKLNQQKVFTVLNGHPVCRVDHFAFFKIQEPEIILLIFQVKAQSQCSPAAVADRERFKHSRTDRRH